MFITLMKSKIHRAKVTEANLDYIGSITIDEDLMDAADIMKNEKVQIVNNNNGQRFETYVIPGERKSGMICLNGAAARLVHPDDIIIIISYGIFDRKEAAEFTPKIIFVDENNGIKEVKEEEKHGHIYKS
jgi:aspartate 1-decarboxylase